LVDSKERNRYVIIIDKPLGIPVPKLYSRSHDSYLSLQALITFFQRIARKKTKERIKKHKKTVTNQKEVVIQKRRKRKEATMIQGKIGLRVVALVHFDPRTITMEEAEEEAKATMVVVVVVFPVPRRRPVSFWP
jgi:hypothetical protein